uniref:Zinc finger PHD-type domain-containing protein n=1 Tax=Chromera velia CCMP2878 TaxID=1169474 RepID=A0A0G4G2F6_9ALVE|eukprot:Cvel_4064.t1-p1 / transcript=Cvel_4064.t1 / gene=Cvel_4064 / organism=Chromera_velia_CCMP2878 / gene_product=hypothetical protein / transcript_product=hypothetical protein / location=Cvel_scaffold173:43672-53629(-) / protein_length=1005 / sequence_SO=supercontig / SO=protein_coding / is_pseudo=false
MQPPHRPAGVSGGGGGGQPHHPGMQQQIPQPFVVGSSSNAATLDPRGDLTMGFASAETLGVGVNPHQAQGNPVTQPPFAAGMPPFAQPPFAPGNSSSAPLPGAGVPPVPPPQPLYATSNRDLYRTSRTGTETSGGTWGGMGLGLAAQRPVRGNRLLLYDHVDRVPQRPPADNVGFWLPEDLTRRAAQQQQAMGGRGLKRTVAEELPQGGADSDNPPTFVEVSSSFRVVDVVRDFNVEAMFARIDKQNAKKKTGGYQEYADMRSATGAQNQVPAIHFLRKRAEGMHLNILSYLKELRKLDRDLKIRMDELIEQRIKAFGTAEAKQHYGFCEDAGSASPSPPPGRTPSGGFALAQRGHNLLSPPGSLPGRGMSLPSPTGSAASVGSGGGFMPLVAEYLHPEGYTGATAIYPIHAILGTDAKTARGSGVGEAGGLGGAPAHFAQSLSVAAPVSSSSSSLPPPPSPSVKGRQALRERTEQQQQGGEEKRRPPPLELPGTGPPGVPDPSEASLGSGGGHPPQLDVTRPSGETVPLSVERQHKKDLAEGFSRRRTQKWSTMSDVAKCQMCFQLELQCRALAESKMALAVALEDEILHLQDLVGSLERHYQHAAQVSAAGGTGPFLHHPLSTKHSSGFARNVGGIQLGGSQIQAQRSPTDGSASDAASGQVQQKKKKQRLTATVAGTAGEAPPFIHSQQIVLGTGGGGAGREREARGQQGTMVPFSGREAPGGRGGARPQAHAGAGGAERGWCICHKGEFGRMVKCSMDKECNHGVWFHAPCVALTDEQMDRIETDKNFVWTCDGCRGQPWPLPLSYAQGQGQAGHPQPQAQLMGAHPVHGRSPPRSPSNAARYTGGMAARGGAASDSRPLSPTKGAKVPGAASSSSFSMEAAVVAAQARQQRSPRPGSTYAGLPTQQQQAWGALPVRTDSQGSGGALPVHGGHSSTTGTGTTRGISSSDAQSSPMAVPSPAYGPSFAAAANLHGTIGNLLQRQKSPKKEPQPPPPSGPPFR